MKSHLLIVTAQNMEESNLELMFYISLRGFLRFHNEYNSYPGASDPESDTARFKVQYNKFSRMIAHTKFK